MRKFHNNTLSTLVPTKTQATYLEKHGFNNAEILSRGVDCTLYSPSKRSAELRKQWGVNDTTTVCIYVGRLASEKNVELLIESYHRLSVTNPETKFVFVGDGPARTLLQTSCPNAIFAGMQRGEDLAAHYASGDIFLFPSKTDTFGNVVTEAMASGLAVIAFNDAAAKEHLEHKISGLLAELDDDQGYLKLIDELVNNSSLRRSIQENSLELARAISWTEIVDRFESLLLGNSNRNTHKTNLVSSKVETVVKPSTKKINSTNQQARVSA